MKKDVSEMSDEELDDFLKKLSDSQEIPFQTQDWENMKRRLDQRKPSPLNGYKYGFLAMFIALVFLIGFWWINPISDLTGIHDKPIGMETLFPKNPSSSNLEFPQPNLKENLKKSIPDLQYDQKGMPHKSTLPVMQNHKERPKVIENKSAQRYVVPIAFEKALINNKNSIIDRMQFPVEDQLRYRTNSSELNPIGPKSKKKTFSIALLGAPDISAVQFTQIRRAGRSMAINLEYFIHPRWSVNSGLVHGYKTYTSQEGYWPGYIKHEELKGNCWVLEIPINLRYYPIQGLKNNWYLSSGVSSYFMIKEQYSLLQAGDKNYDYSNEIEVKGSNMHPFGVLNLGIGYERKLNQHLSLQVEPYFRLPFGGIGEGEINLKSTGILLGLKYYR